MVQDELSRQSDILRHLARSDVWRTGNRKQAIELLSETAARSLGVERVSIWLYDDSRSGIICEDFFEAASASHGSAANLERADYPAYFQAMDESRVIAATDASLDSRTCEFANGYLELHGIGSMLDAPIVVGGQCLGVICHEHVGGRREWSMHEQMFAGSVADYVGLAIEVFEHRRVETQLSARTKQLEQALRSAKMGLWELEIKTMWLWHSEQVGPLFGMGRNWTCRTESLFHEHVHADDRLLLSQTLNSAVKGERDEYRVEYRAVWPGGQTHWLESLWFVVRDEAGKPQRITGTVANMDERRRMEEQVRHTKRMSDMGRLASSIAHDFNNLLTAMVCSLALLERKMGDDSIGSMEVKNMFEATNRAGALVSQLLAFGRKRPIKPETVDVNALLLALGGILERLVGMDVDVAIVPCDEPCSVFVDSGQFDQIIVNLVVNAKDAMGADGKIDISVARESRAGTSEAPASSDVIAVRVRDSGPGIPPDLVENIFEPFFTTKENHGTGLGLATSYGIAKQAGGELFVEESSSAGTTFTLQLPMVQPA